VYHLTDLLGVALREEGFPSSTRGMSMLTVTGKIQKLGQTRMETSNPPWFPDWKLGYVVEAGNEAIHATVEVRVDKT